MGFFCDFLDILAKNISNTLHRAWDTHKQRCRKCPFIFNSDRTITWSHTFVISATFQSPCPQLCSALSSGCWNRQRVHTINPSWFMSLLPLPPEPTAPSMFILNMMEAMFEHSRDSGSIVLSENVTAVGWIVKFTGLFLLLNFSQMGLNWSQCFTVQMDNDLKHTPKLTKVILKERNGIFFNSETTQLNKLYCYKRPTWDPQRQQKQWLKVELLNAESRAFGDFNLFYLCKKMFSMIKDFIT